MDCGLIKGRSYTIIALQSVSLSTLVAWYYMKV